MPTPPSSILSTNPWVHIKSSNVHGRGVFAKKDIPKGTRIADYWGKEMKWATFKRQYGPYALNSLHTYPMRRIWKIIVAKEEPYLSENVANFMNERNPPNCELKQRGLYSKRPIAKGEELFLLYPSQYRRTWKLTKKRVPRSSRRSTYRRRRSSAKKN